VSGENTLQVYLNPSTPALVTELVGGFSRTVTVKHGVFSAANTYVELASSAYDSMDAGKDISFAIMVRVGFTNFQQPFQQPFHKLETVLEARGSSSRNLNERTCFQVLR
jgi:hypothetical protein